MTKEERKLKLEYMRGRRKELKQPRDWQIWHAYLIHVVEGIISGAIAMSAVIQQSTQLAILAFSLVVMYLAYQWGSWMRKDDYYGRDVKDWAVGYALGIITLWVYSNFM